MGRSRLDEVNFHEFTDQLRAAANSGARIEPTDKQRWKEWVKENEIFEASAMTIARSKAENCKPVIISEGPWTGYYIFATDEQVSLKFVRED